MIYRLLPLSIAGALFAAPSLHAHGPGHHHGHEESELVEQAVVDGAQPVVRSQTSSAAVSPSGKSFQTPLPESGRIWGASLTAGWESRHIHYGVDETGNGGAYTTELTVWIQNLALGFWSGFGTGNDFQEFDFTASYQVNAGPVFLIPGYNFRYSPGHGHAAHDDHAEEHHEEEGHHDESDHEEHSDQHHHAHKTYGHELFLVLGTDAIPYVTPSTVFVWDLNNTPGAYLEFRLDGEIPIYGNGAVTLEPYALLGLNFGYNTRDRYGWNNFQFGTVANWRINRIVSVYAGINYSLAMTALRAIGQGNEVWANVGVSFTY